jgi:hypothetical protein
MLQLTQEQQHFLTDLTEKNVKTKQQVNAIPFVLCL